MLYSVRMRAAQGSSHETGGRHISGSERLVGSKQIGAITQQMLERALLHSRGQADFIQITLETLSSESISEVPLLSVQTVDVVDVAAGRAAAQESLTAAGVLPIAAKKGIAQLLALKDSMRGAMLVCAETGDRLDKTGMRGIRVSRMDIQDELSYTTWLEQQGLSTIHAREALVLAAKVASAPAVVAELCWSDDPEYTAGYVASKRNYIRFTKLKQYGSPNGGRLFFIRPNSCLETLRTYLELQAVLVTVPAGEAQ